MSFNITQVIRFVVVIGKMKYVLYVTSVNKHLIILIQYIFLKLKKPDVT